MQNIKATLINFKNFWSIGSIYILLIFAQLLYSSEKNQKNSVSSISEYGMSSTLYLVGEDKSLSETQGNSPWPISDTFYSSDVSYVWDEYYLTGDISGDMYAIALYFQGIGTSEMKAEIYMNDNVVAEKQFVCSDCLFEEKCFAFSFSGEDPSTSVGDELKLKVTMISGDPIDIIWGHSECNSSIVIPSITSVDQNENISIKNYHLNQNYPNPFNNGTTIVYSILRPTFVQLSIVNVKGKIVRNLVNSVQESGTKHIFWNGKDDIDNVASSGMYFVRLTADHYSSTKKILLIR